jgi:hypothetical protein
VEVTAMCKVICVELYYVVSLIHCSSICNCQSYDSIAAFLVNVLL